MFTSRTRSVTVRPRHFQTESCRASSRSRRSNARLHRRRAPRVARLPRLTHPRSSPRPDTHRDAAGSASVPAPRRVERSARGVRAARVERAGEGCASVAPDVPRRGPRGALSGRDQAPGVPHPASRLGRRERDRSETQGARRAGGDGPLPRDARRRLCRALLAAGRSARTAREQRASRARGGWQTRAAVRDARAQPAARLAVARGRNQRRGGRRQERQAPESFGRRDVSRSARVFVVGADGARRAEETLLGRRRAARGDVPPAVRLAVALEARQDARDARKRRREAS